MARFARREREQVVQSFLSETEHKG